MLEGPLGTPPGSHSEEPGKILPRLWSGKGENNHTKYSQNILSNKGLFSRGNDVSRSYNPWGKDISLIPVLLNFSVSLKGGRKRNLRNIGKGHRPTKRLRFNHKIIECLRFSTPYHHAIRLPYTDIELYLKKLQMQAPPKEKFTGNPKGNGEREQGH